MGYIACVMDMPRTEFHETGQMLWQTREGMFTLLRRPCGKGRPDNLVVYITSKPISPARSRGKWISCTTLFFLTGAALVTRTSFWMRTTPIAREGTIGRQVGTATAAKLRAECDDEGGEA